MSIKRFKRELTDYELSHWGAFCTVENSQCSETFGRAHPISKSSILRELAVNGHLYKIGTSPNTLNSVSLEKVGIKRAGTFFGFCKFHDNGLFECVDSHPFDRNNLKQKNALAMRAWGFGIFHQVTLTQYAISLQSYLTGIKTDDCKIPNLFKSYTRDEKRKFIDFFNKEILIKRNILKSGIFLRASFYKVIKDKMNRSLNHKVFVLSKKALFAYCSTHWPMVDFNGVNYSKYGMSPDTENPPNLMINIFSQDNKTYCLLSYHKRDFNVISKVIKQLQRASKERLETLLSSMISAKPDGLLISPKIHEFQRKTIEGLITAKLYDYNKDPKLSYETLPNEVNFFDLKVDV